MATSSPAPPTLTPPPVQTARDVEVIEYERYIDKQLRKTSSEVKLVDLVSRLLVAGVWLLAVLLVVGFVEHWVVSGGLPGWVRWGVFIAIVGTAGWYLKRFIWPLLSKRINPLYAAQTIEQHSPGLKNSLLNLLFFRQKNEKVAPAVYRAIEQQAAVGLSSAPQETPVDRTHLIRVMFAFLVLVAFGAIYKMASPKDPIASAGRVLLPWSDIKPPTRVDIQDVTPGDASLPFGETVEISATVRGLREGESVLLRYTTQDKQAIDREIVMEPATGSRYRCDFPPAPKRGQPKGIQQNTEYQIVAGDAKSSLFHLTKIDRPTMTLERVELAYPKYTGFQPHTLTSGGDIRAIEGTRITVYSQANQRIASAGIDWNVDGLWDVEMQVSGDAKQTASGAFTLELEEDRRTPKQQSYVLRFKNERDELNYEPVRYRIDVLPDYAPEVSLLTPEKEVVDVQIDKTIEITVEASDPDFALSQVTLKMENEGQELAAESFLQEEFKGKFTGRWEFSPQKLKLQVGDEVTYWFVAADNRTPEANKTLTRRQRLRIVAGPAKPEGDEENQNPNQDQTNSEKQDSNQRGNKHVDENDDQQQSKNKSSDNKESEGKQGNKEGKKGDGKGGSAGGESSDEGDSNAESSDKNRGGSDGKSGKRGDENEASNDKNQQHEQGEGGKGTGEGEPNAQNQNDGAEQQEGMENGDANGQKGSRKKDGSNDPAGKQNKNNAPDEQNQQNEGAEGSKQGEGNNAENSQNQEPVAKDGSDDGDAFDRIREHLNKKSSKNQPEENSADQQKGNRKNPESQDAQQDKPQGDNTNPKTGTENSGEKGTEQDSKQGSKQARDSKNFGENGTADGGEKGQQDTRSEGKNGSGGEAGDKQEGTEAKPQGDSNGKEKGAEGSKNKKQQGENSKENVADGKKPKDGSQAAENAESSETETPNSNDGKKPSDANPSDGSESGQPANDKKNKSQTAGDDSGDRSGNGSRGDGKESPQKGTGNPGDKQSAEDGNGQSKEKGNGDVSDKQGSDSATDKQTGNSENKSGEGQGKKNGEGEKSGGKPKEGKKPGEKGNKEHQGDNPSGKKEEGQGGKPADDSKKNTDGNDAHSGNNGRQGNNSQDKSGKPKLQDPKDAAKPSDPNGGPANGQIPQGGDRGGPRGDVPDSDIPDTFQGDDANLDYAKKQTDMVLESLEDQLKNKKVDQELLDKLHWSEKDLEQFVERWKRRKALAKGTGKEAAEARRKLDESLRSLGLRKRPLRRKGAAGKIDTKRKARDGYRGNVPPELQQQLQDYTRKISKKKS